MLDLSQVLIRPIITEKSIDGTQAGRYTFEVHPRANKIQVKRAIEQFLNVDVIDVNTMRVSGKSRRYGRSIGKTKSWKKALITVKPGQKIELFES